MSLQQLLNLLYIFYKCVANWYLSFQFQKQTFTSTAIAEKRQWPEPNGIQVSIPVSFSYSCYSAVASILSCCVGNEEHTSIFSNTFHGTADDNAHISNSTAKTVCQLVRSSLYIASVSCSLSHYKKEIKVIYFG